MFSNIHPTTISHALYLQSLGVAKYDIHYDFKSSAEQRIEFVNVYIGLFEHTGAPPRKLLHLVCLCMPNEAGRRVCEAFATVW